MKVMPVDLSRLRIDIELRSWEQPLPTPLRGGIGVLTFQSVRQEDTAKAVFDVGFVLLSDKLQVAAEEVLDRRKQHGYSILIYLSTPNLDLIGGKINVLDPEPQAFHQP